MSKFLIQVVDRETSQVAVSFDPGRRAEVDPASFPEGAGGTEGTFVVIIND